MKTLTLILLFAFIATGSYATPNKKTVKIRLASQSGSLDETLIYFDLGTSPTYIANQDAPKTFSNVPHVPAIYSLSSDNVLCSINGYSTLANSETISLGFDVDTNGLYIFSAFALTNFDPTSTILLEDRLTNTFIDLRTNFYTVQLADADVATGRFFLHISYPTQLSTIAAGCADNDGTLQIFQDSTILWAQCNLFDSLGNLVNGFQNVTGAFSFNNLSEGDYNINFIYGDYSATKPIHMSGNSIKATISAPAQIGYVNQEMNFFSSTHNATHSEWNFGDGTIITGIYNPTYAYPESGSFEVVLTCTNSFGCKQQDSVTVNIMGATGINNVTQQAITVTVFSKTITVNLNSDVTANAEIKVISLLGQQVYTNAVTNQLTTISLNEQPSGYYLVSVIANHKVQTKRVFIGQ